MLFLLAVIFGSASGLSPCCFDRQYEVSYHTTAGSMTTLANGTSRSVLIDTETRGHYDYYNNKVALVSTGVVGKTHFSNKVIIDLKTFDAYYITNGTCRSSKYIKLPSSLFRPCLPDTAKVIERSHLGFGTMTVPFTTYGYRALNDTLSIHFSVTDVGCIPLIESVFGGGKYSQVSSSGDALVIFTNFKPGISDPSVFTPPQPCPVSGRT